MLKSSRKKKKITQKFLQLKTGISQSYISKLENSENINPTIHEVLILANELDLCPLELFNWFLNKHQNYNSCCKECLTDCLSMCKESCLKS